MKFVYFGYDFMLESVRRLRADGHELLGIFTFPCDNVFNFNTKTIALANDLNLPASIEKPRPEHIEFFRQQGCEVFISAGYLYKIPPVEPAHGINIHPSLLPKGRSIMPIPYILLDHPEMAGFTIHKLTEKLDTGDILYQEALPVSKTETVESLSDRMAAQTPDALSKIMKNLPHMWKNAKPQNEADAVHFPAPTDEMRVLDWNLPLERIDKIARAFGHYGSLAKIDGQLWGIYAHEIKYEKHDLKPGTVTVHDKNLIIVVAKDGFITFKQFDRVSADRL